jgi:hypothetical protein
LESGVPVALLQPAKKRFDNLSGKITEKLAPRQQYFRLDIYRSTRNNLSQFPTTTQKGSSYAQPAVG